MASFNRVILAGNLTRDVELRFLQSGTAVTEIGLAVNNRRKNQAGEWVEETVFVDVTLWGRTAEVASEYLGKGSSVLIEGRLKLDTWEKDGHKHSKLRVIGESMQMLGAPRGGGNGASGSGRPRTESRTGNVADARITTDARSSSTGGPHFDEPDHSSGGEMSRGSEPAMSAENSDDIPF